MKPFLKLSICLMVGLISTLVAVGSSGQPARGLGPWNADRDGWREPLQLTYIANMGVLVSSGNQKVLIDALFDRPNEAYRAPSPENLEKMMRGEAPFDGVDLVLVTHNHPDHFDARVATRYLEALPGPVLLAPADAAAGLRTAAADWARIESRVILLDLKAGEKERRDPNRIPVTAFRTLHSGDQETPMNVMYLFDLNGWSVFHEGDSAGKVDQYREFGLGSAPVDLALIHYWFPLDPNCASFLQETFKPNHIGLMHLPIRLEGDAPGKIDQVREYYKDIFLMLPGMPTKTFQKEPGSVLSDRESIFGQAPPGLEPVRFVPEILTSEKHPHGQLAFSPDGKNVFWSAMLQDGPEQTIYCSTFNGKTLSKPEVAPFAAASGNGGPAFSADGRRLFFSAELLPAGDPAKRSTSICYVDRSGSGWTKPSVIESTVDSRMTKGQVSVARSGNIYFTGRVLTKRTPGIYICKYSDGGYLSPEKLSGPLASGAPLVDPWVDPDEKFMLLSCFPREGPPMRPDVGISYRQADGTWSKPAAIGGAVNTPAYERFPSLSRDGKYLFFIRSYSEGFVGDQAHFYWVDASVLGNAGRS
jgi:L-ascorbate metabolism protein UlaG (beta-lactamase superfamily)